MQSILSTNFFLNNKNNLTSSSSYESQKDVSASSKLSVPLWSTSEWDSVHWQNWHQQNWIICVWFALFYVISVHFGVYLMRDRQPLKLQKPLALWNFLLGIFSIAGSFYFVPEILHVLRHDGFHAAACDNSFAQNSNLIFWSWLFVWSKIFEFGDTAFIILRKRKLSFLHWYHHAMTVICVFTYFPGMIAINRWTASMNFFVHSIMYSYYTVRALHIRVPKPVAIMITSMQIAQMIIGFCVAIYELAMKIGKVPCKITLGQSIFSFSIYFSYFVLFSVFFYRAYMGKSHASSVSSEQRILDKSTQDLKSKCE